MTISDTIAQLSSLECPRCGYEHDTERIIAYIRALEKVREAAKEAIQRERMDETYGADLSEIEYAVKECDALAAAREAGK